MHRRQAEAVDTTDIFQRATAI